MRKEIIMHENAVKAMDKMVERFDTTKAALLYQQIDWKWFDGFPSPSRIEHTLYSLAKSAYERIIEENSFNAWSATGGLKVTCYYYHPDKYVFYAAFEAVSSESDVFYT